MPEKTHNIADLVNPQWFDLSNYDLDEWAPPEETMCVHRPDDNEYGDGEYEHGETPLDFA